MQTASVILAANTLSRIFPCVGIRKYSLYNFRIKVLSFQSPVIKRYNPLIISFDA